MDVRLDEAGNGDPAARVQHESRYLRCVLWDSNEAPPDDGEITQAIGIPYRNIFYQDIESHRRPFAQHCIGKIAAVVATKLALHIRLPIKATSRRSTPAFQQVKLLRTVAEWCSTLGLARSRSSLFDPAV
jgi:hypothetical protein